MPLEKGRKMTVHDRFTKRPGLLLKVLYTTNLRPVSRGMASIIFYYKQLPEVFYKKGVLRNFAKFTGKHLCQSLFFN